MIVAAGLLVLLGLGLFVGALVTGTTAFYWGCVAVCAVAAVLLFLARRHPKAGDAAPVPASADEPTGAQALSDPPVEEVEVTDLLLVIDLTDEVLVLDERPRYHLAGCVHLTGRTTIPLPLDEARSDGFTPCAVCAPDRNLAERARARKATPEG